MQIVGLISALPTSEFPLGILNRDLRQPQPIGVEGTTTMPAVVALHRESGVQSLLLWAKMQMAFGMTLMRPW